MALLRVFRVHRQARLANDCGGAAAIGGRWNPPGYPILYTSTHLSLAMLEVFVHFAAVNPPEGQSYSWADIPAPERSLDPEGLFLRGRREDCQEIGKQWLVNGRERELAVYVPSVVVPSENNVLLNPFHADFSGISWQTEVLPWDERMLRLVNSRLT